MQRRRTPFFLMSTMAIWVLTTGCPYESTTPISVQGSQVPSKILGTWLDTSTLDEPDDEQTTFEISTDSNNRIIVTKHETDTEGEKSETTYYGHLTLVGDMYFANIENLEDAEMGLEDDWAYEDEQDDWMEETEPLYSLFGLEIMGKRMRIRPVTSNISESFDSSDELKRFIEKHKDLSFFYNNDDEIVLIHRSVFED